MLGHRMYMYTTTSTGTVLCTVNELNKSLLLIKLAFYTSKYTLDAL